VPGQQDAIRWYDFHPRATPGIISSASSVQSSGTSQALSLRVLLNETSIYGAWPRHESTSHPPQLKIVPASARQARYTDRNRAAPRFYAQQRCGRWYLTHHIQCM